MNSCIQIGERKLTQTAKKMRSRVIDGYRPFLKSKYIHTPAHNTPNQRVIDVTFKKAEHTFRMGWRSLL